MTRQPAQRRAPPDRVPYCHHILSGLFFALLPVLPLAADAQAPAASRLSCPAMQLGQPCPGPGLTAPGAAEPALNLGLDNPVHLASGRKFLRDTDLPAHPQAPGLELVRYYNSADPRRHGSPGAAWQFSYDLRLYRLANHLQLIQADGSRLRFACAAGLTVCQHEGQGSLHLQTEEQTHAPADAPADAPTAAPTDTQTNAPADRQTHEPAGGWQWRWPDGSRLDFRRDGWLVSLRRPDGRLLARLDRAADGRLLAAHGATPDRQLIFHYQHETGRAPRLHSIDTPLGRFRYHHDAVPEGWRLSRVERPDGMQRHYAHDPALQSGHPLAITASGLSAPGHAARWQRRWHYDPNARVIRLEYLGAGGQATAAWHLEYREPAHGSHAGLTRVRGPQGTTDVHYLRYGSRYLLSRISGAPCPGCAAPGLQAQYDAAGRLSGLNGLNGLRLRRHPNGAVRELALSGSGWPGLRLRFDAAGRPSASYSHRTGLTRWRHAPPLQPMQASSRDTASANRAAGRAPAHPSDSLPGLLPAPPVNLSAKPLAEPLAEPIAEQPAEPPTEHRHEPLTERFTKRFTEHATKHFTDTRTKRPPEPSTEPHPGPPFWQHDIRYANGDRWRARYDAQGLPTHLAASQPLPPPAPSSPSGSSASAIATPATLHTRLAWQHGQLLELAHPHESEQREYDAAGRLRARHIQRPGDNQTPAFTLTDRYDYHPDGRLALHYLPEGGLLSYAWQRGRLHRLEWQDSQGQRHLILQTLPGQAGYRTGNGVHTLGQRDAQGLRALISALPGARTPLLAQAIRLDPAGRLAAEQIQTGHWRQHFRYAYDASGRLAVIEAATPEAASLPAPAASATYLAWHADGSLQGLQGLRPSASAPLPGGAWSLPLPPLTEDASGLPLQRGGWQLAYDPQRRLRQARHPASQLTIEYLNNAHGQRIRRGSGPAAIHYLYDPQGLRTALASASTGTGTSMRITERYLYIGQIPVAWLRYGAAGETRLDFIHTDAQGLPRALSDRQGQLAWQAEFDVFGRLLRESGGSGPSHRYPGQHADPDLPWYDNGMRTYDPATGSYLEPDPLGPLPGHDAYGYAAQRPRQYADPSGMLLYAFDGTRNTPASRTNVWLLHQLYPEGRHYQPGPGDSAWDTATASRAGHILSTQWERLLADLAAAGRQWQQQPAAIDLLGYSRGAALAQHFANQIAAHVSNQRFWAYDPSMGTVSACIDLRFMGLFDTVAQFGVNGRDNTNYLLGASPAWQWIAHAVALHEHRYLFPANSLGQGQANVAELPFIGAHADIGGGYQSSATPEAARGDLSDVALAWIHWQARAAGVPLLPLPAEHATVSQPLLHDERNVFYRKTGQDRPVHHADGRPWLDSQADHAALGRGPREATEAFIERLPDWMQAPGSVTGTVDMAAYQAWLNQRGQPSPQPKRAPPPR